MERGIFFLNFHFTWVAICLLTKLVNRATYYMVENTKLAKSEKEKTQRSKSNQQMDVKLQNFVLHVKIIFFSICLMIVVVKELKKEGTTEQQRNKRKAQGADCTHCQDNRQKLPHSNASSRSFKEVKKDISFFVITENHCCL